MMVIPISNLPYYLRGNTLCSDDNYYYINGSKLVRTNQILEFKNEYDKEYILASVNNFDESINILSKISSTLEKEFTDYDEILDFLDEQKLIINQFLNKIENESI